MKKLLIVIGVILAVFVLLSLSLYRLHLSRSTPSWNVIKDGARSGELIQPSPIPVRGRANVRYVQRSGDNKAISISITSSGPPRAPRTL